MVEFWGFWGPPLSLMLLVFAQAEIHECQSQQTVRQALSTHRTSEKMPDQQLYSVNSGAGTENPPGLECNQETSSPLKLTWGWTRHNYWKILSSFFECAWEDKDDFPKDHNTQQFIRNARTQRHWVALPFLLIHSAEMGFSRMRHGHLIYNVVETHSEILYLDVWHP